MQGFFPDQIETEIEQIMRGLYEGIKETDFELWLGTLHDPAGPWLLGMDMPNIREASEELKVAWTANPEIGHERQEIDDLQIRVVAVSPTVAYALCTSSDRRWYFADGRVDRAATAESWVFVLTDDGWKIHSGQTAMFPVEE